MICMSIFHLFLESQKIGSGDGSDACDKLTRITFRSDFCRTCVIFSFKLEAKDAQIRL